MPHKPLPKDAPRIAPSEIDQLLDIPAGLSKTYTTVRGAIVKRTQTEHGMGKGSDVHEITADCPKCDGTLTFHSALPAGKHPIICSCDRSVVFAVEWSLDGAPIGSQPTLPPPKKQKTKRK